MRYFTEFGSFQAHYVKVVEDTPILSAQKCSPKNLVLAMYYFFDICRCYRERVRYA